MSEEVLKKLQLQAMKKFPDSNPNPVLKSDMTGKVIYSNESGQFILEKWNMKIGEDLPPEILQNVDKTREQQLELPVGNNTYSFHVVSVPGFDFINIYGTDITAMKAITKFPDSNPNPIMRVSNDCSLSYVNIAGKEICNDWGIGIGERVPDVLLNGELLHEGQLEVKVTDRIYMFHIVHVVEFEFYNMYITDVTDTKSKEAILSKLAKYFSPQVYHSIFTGNLEVKIQTERKKLTVFFSDIKGFSEITERLQPEVLTELLTEYLTAMTRIAIKHGGTVDKYIGDAIMVFFGDPHTQGTKQDAISCVEMALEMKQELIHFRKKWRSMGISQPLDIRIGIHSDTCTVGNFGSEDRLDYTTVGNGVNLASRLESNANVNQILISEDTYLLVQEDIACEKLEKITVKNIKHPIQTYEVRGRKCDIVAESEMSIEEEGFSLFIHPKSIDNVNETREALEKAIALLDSLT
jgi:class 3 adenylate cyclase